MPQPVLGPFAQSLYDDLAPLAYDDANQSWALAHYINAIAQTMEDIEALIRDQSGLPGWSQAIDINRAPIGFLAWLGQFVGVQLDKGLTDAQQRQVIRNEAGFSRGTLQAMVSAAQRYLVGQQTVIVRERYPGPYQLEIITYTSDTQVDNFSYDNMLGKNMIPDPSFETDVSFWGVGSSGSGLTRDLAQHLDGVACMRVTLVGAGSQPYAVSPLIPVTPGQQYSWLANVLAGNVARATWVAINWWDASSVYISQVVTAPSNNSALWTPFSVSAQAPSNAAYASVFVVMNGCSGGDYCFVDRVQFEQSPNPTAYSASGEARYVNVYNDYVSYAIPYNLGGGTSNLIQAALMAQKPAGIILDYHVLSGQDYGEVWFDWPDYAAVVSHYGSYQDLMDDAPRPHPFTFQAVLYLNDYQALYDAEQTYYDVWASYISY